MPGCRILYVAPLSLVPHEVEFISPINSKFLYNIDQTTNNETLPTLSNNNIKRRYGICSKENERFRSLDIVLAFTPQPSNNDDHIGREIGVVADGIDWLHAGHPAPTG